MKPVVIIAIVAVAMIGVMLPDVLGTKYVNESPYDFSIDYPYGWLVDGIQEVDSAQDFIENGVAIYDKDDWSTMMNIYIIEDVTHQLSDNEEINLMNEVERDFCNNFTFNNDGMICYDFVLLSEKNNSMVYEINGYRAITIFYAFTDVYSDSNYPGEYPRIGTTTHIYAENDIWQIVSVSEEEVFDKHSDLILDTVASFRFENNAIQKEGINISSTIQQPTAQNTCPQGTTTEIRGLDIVCVPKKTVEKTCPDGTYLGKDNNGNSACRSIQTNQIDIEQNKEIITTPPKIQEPKVEEPNPIPLLDNDNFIIVAIIGVVIIAVIVIAIAKKSSGSKTSNTTTYSSYTDSYNEKTPATPSRVVPAYSGEENPDFALKQFDFTKGLERVIEVTYNKEKEVDVKLFFSADKDEWSTFVRNYKEKVKDNFIRLNIEPSKRTNSGLISGGNYEFNDDFDAGYTLRVSMKYSDKKLMAKITSVLRENDFGCLPSTKFTVDAHRNYEHPTEYEAEKILASVTDKIYQKLT